MRLDFQEIASIIEKRRSDRSYLVQKMLEVQERYNGDYVVPLPNDDESSLPPLTPAIIFEAIDQTALNANSISPSIYVPALDPAKDTGVNSKEWANIRRKAMNYTWKQSYLDTYVFGRAFRHLAGYGTASMVVVPDFECDVPLIKARDPLSTYPDPRTADDPTPPENIGFIFGKSPTWILNRFPEAANVIKNANQDPSVTWDLVEWIDEHDVVIGLLGPRNDAVFSSLSEARPQYQKELRRWPNRAGRCTAYTPARVTLDRIASAIANNLGIVDMMSILLWLDVRATEKSIYPDRYILGRNGNTPSLLGGQWKEGTTGEVNIITEADAIGEIRGTPDPNNKATIQMLERNFSRSAGLTGPMTGEINGALRSGRTVDSLMASSTDPRIQELHRIMEVTMTHMNEIVIESFKGYWANKQYSVFSGIAGDDFIKFQPSKHFEACDNIVSYPIPGADMSSTTVNLGQLQGAGAISLHTFRQKHPWISDSEREEEQILIEQLEEAQRQGAFQAIASGSMDFVSMSDLIEKIKKGVPQTRAFKEVHDEAQKRQATEAPPAEPGQAAPPEVMSGITPEGSGAQMAPPPGEGAPPMPQGEQLQALLGAMGKAPSGAGAP